MKNKFIVLIVTLVISIPTLTLFSEEITVKADVPPPTPQFNYSYIFEIASELSKSVIDITDSGLDKGRAFASEGERAAANYLADEMQEIGLYDPTTYTTSKPMKDGNDPL